MQMMKYAVSEAKNSDAEVPVGAVIVKGNTILAACHNEVISSCNPTAHAEMLAIQKACLLEGSPRLTGCDIYITLEPCPMCAAAICEARIDNVYFGAYDIKKGALGGAFDLYRENASYKKPTVYGGIMEDECKALLSSFFKNLR